MVTADIAENDLIEMLRFNIFERNKVSLEIKLAAVAMYLLSSSFRRIAYSLTLENQLFITGLIDSRMHSNTVVKRK